MRTGSESWNVTREEEGSGTQGRQRTSFRIDRPSQGAGPRDISMPRASRKFGRFINQHGPCADRRLVEPSRGVGHSGASGFPSGRHGWPTSRPSCCISPPATPTPMMTRLTCSPTRPARWRPTRGAARGDRLRPVVGSDPGTSDEGVLIRPDRARPENGCESGREDCGRFGETPAVNQLVLGLCPIRGGEWDNQTSMARWLTH